MQIERASERPAPRTAGRYHRIGEAAELVLQQARVPGAASSRGMIAGDLRGAIFRLCVVAHAEQLPIERVIVVLKERWASLPEIRRLPRGGETDATLACVITQCILDFYSPGQSADIALPEDAELNRTHGDSK